MSSTFPTQVSRLEYFILSSNSPLISPSVTLVQDDTHVSITAALETAGIVVPIDVQCDIDGVEGVCRQVVGTGIDATSFTESGAVFLTPVPIGEGATGIDSGIATTRSSVSITFSTPSATDILPPLLSSTGRGTATLTDAISTETGEAVPSGGSSIFKTGLMVTLGTVVPAVFSAALLL